MNSIQRAVKNVVAILTGDATSKALAVVATVLLARYLGPEDYGKYCSVLSFIYVFVIMADFGLNDLMIRDVAVDHSLASQYLGASVVIKIISSTVCALLLVSFVYVLGYSAEMRLYMAVLSATILFVTFCNTVSSIFKAFEKMQYSSFIMIINSTLFLILIAVLIYANSSLLEILFSRVVALFIGSLIAYILIVKTITTPNYTNIVYNSRRLITGAFPFLAIGLVHTLYFNLDIIMLSKLKGSIYVGWFSPAANDLFFGLIIIPSAIATVTYPIFSRKYAEEAGGFSEYFNFTMKILIILGVAISMGTFLLAKEIIDFIFGAKYDNSVIVLQIISLSITFAFVRDLLGYGWASVRKVKTLMYLNVISLAINAVLNLILIPLYAHIGAAVASVFCIVTASFISYFMLKNEVKRLNVSGSILKPIAASLIMCSVIYALSGLHVVLLIIIGALVYIASLFMLRTFNTLELTYLKQALHIH